MSAADRDPSCGNRPPNQCRLARRWADGYTCLFPRNYRLPSGWDWLED